MLNKCKNKHLIKIPKNIKVLYCDRINILTFTGLFSTKSLKLKVRIFLNSSLNSIVVTDVSISDLSGKELKNIKKTQGTTVARIKQILIETAYVLHYKLSLIGVGYRVFPYEKSKNHLYLKLGFSHLIYFKVSDFLNVYCQNFTRLFLFGSGSFDNLTQTASQIKAFKRPEPYKGKGIEYNQEKILLKKGKKV